MTDAPDNAPEDDGRPAEEDRTKPVYVVPVPGTCDKDEDGRDVPGTERHIRMYAPTENHLAIYLRVMGDLDQKLDDEARRRRALRNVGLVFQSLDRLITNESDRWWLDTAILDGRLPVLTALDLIVEAARIHAETIGEDKAPTAGPVRLK